MKNIKHFFAVVFCFTTMVFGQTNLSDQYYMDHEISFALKIPSTWNIEYINERYVRVKFSQSTEGLNSLWVSAVTKSEFQKIGFKSFINTQFGYSFKDFDGEKDTIAFTEKDSKNSGKYNMVGGVYNDQWLFKLHQIPLDGYYLIVFHKYKDVIDKNLGKNMIHSVRHLIK